MADQNNKNLEKPWINDIENILFNDSDIEPDDLTSKSFFFQSKSLKNQSNCRKFSQQYTDIPCFKAKNEQNIDLTP